MKKIVLKIEDDIEDKVLRVLSEVIGEKGTIAYEEEKKGNLAKFAGRLKLKLDPLKIQKSLREEWG